MGWLVAGDGEDTGGPSTDKACGSSGSRQQAPVLSPLLSWGLCPPKNHAPASKQSTPPTHPPTRQAIIYEMHVGSFTPEGTLAAAIERLPHIASLGFTLLELMPCQVGGGEGG